MIDLDLDIGQVIFAIIGFIAGVVGIGVFIYSNIKKKKSLSKYLKTRLPRRRIIEITEKFQNESPIEGLDRYEYSHILNKIDRLDDQEIDILSKIDLQRWIDIQRDILTFVRESRELVRQTQNAESEPYPDWKFSEVIASFSNFDYVNDDKVFATIQPHIIRILLDEIIEHRKSLQMNEEINRETPDA
jgi:hypothetical protein